MQRLLKISFDQILLSLTPILSWFLLSLIIDKNLINIFTITYPLQFIYILIRSPLATGANISRIRDKNQNAAMSGLIRKRPTRQNHRHLLRWRYDDLYIDK